MTGRSKEYTRTVDPDYYLKGREYLKTPVRKVIYTKTRPIDSLTAGMYALSELSMINTPDHPIMAIDRNKLDLELIEVTKNKDKRNEYQEEYRLKNKDKVRECQRKHYEKNKDKRNEYSKQYYLKKKLEKENKTDVTS
jgi:hypothetical protein